jgi:hypothetical protein
MALPGVHRIELAAVAACLCLGLACSGSLGMDGMGKAGTSGSIGGATGLPTGGGGAGVPACVPTPGPLSCPGAVCGDGIRTGCVVPLGVGACGETTLSEACDGAQLGGETCQTRGYGSGTLACSPYCELDASRCSECILPSAALLRCGGAPVPAVNVMAAAIAANDAEVGLAWIDQVGVEPPVLWFARLSPTLDLIATTRIADPALAVFDRDYAAFRLSLAPLPSGGWVLTGFAQRDALLVVLDQEGRRVVAPNVTLPPVEKIMGYLFLAPRADGGPLLVWMDSKAIHVAVISADGHSATAPLDLPNRNGLVWDVTATFTAGAFHVGMLSDTGANDSQLTIYRVSSDGTLAATFDALPGVTALWPRLADGGADLCLVYLAATGADVLWQPLDASGEARGEPTLVAGDQYYPNPSRTLSFGADTVALLPDFNARSALAVAHVASNGSIAVPPTMITSGVPTFWYDAVRRGPDLVVAWLPGGTAIRIARVAP